MQNQDISPPWSWMTAASNETRGQEMGTADASYGGCSEGQDRAPQAQEVEQHTGKIRKAPLGRVPSCA